MIPVLPPHQAVKGVPVAVQIYQYDAAPANGRQPLLVVHGLHDEYAPSFKMQDICSYLSKSEDFRKRYKIYLARYNSLARETDNEESFKPVLRQLSAEQGKPVTIVCVSVVGNTIRKVLADSSVDPCVSEVIAMGTPFHGSPLFDQDWIAYSMWQNHHWPTRFWRYVAYSAYFHHHPNLLADYYWDNCDGKVPSVGSYCFRLPFAVQGKLSPRESPPLGASDKQSGEKIIAYGGYLQTKFTSQPSSAKRPHVLAAIGFFLRVTVPAYLGKEHAMLRLLDHEIAMSVTSKHTLDTNYAFNDGISPIISTLSAAGDHEYNLNDERDVETLKANVSVKKARLFANTDHITFLDGRPPYGEKTIEVSDKLSPQEKPKSVFAWLLGDLLD